MTQSSTVPLASASSSSAESSPPGRGHGLDIEGITHRFGDVTVLNQIHLQVNPGEFVALLGPSGCGKTTILRLVAGLLTPTVGQIRIDGQRVEHVPTHKRNVGIVFQNYALFPHMNVFDNVAYGLRAQGAKTTNVRSRVQDMLELVQLEVMGDRFPNELSGGQQQRIALARALAVEPRILLLDEPFSALDKNLRLDMQIEVKRLLTEQGITTMFVTHDQEEALSMADRIAVMSNGVVQQFDTPTTVYDRPSTLFVSQFVGTTNLISGTLIQHNRESCVVSLADGEQMQLAIDPDMPINSPVQLAIRPENLRLSTEPSPNALPVRVDICLPLGAATIYEVRTASGIPIKVTQPRGIGVKSLVPGQTVYLTLASAHACSIFHVSDTDPSV
ncbi:ABC transporter ATP-binding protein [Vacuolonema iberomarrocanum]|uniref:ABC transporter ATP-binding protein n=1 Tax=Vacuolonema iberomarrocanum TaxID=3454632 RepID=UPI001A004687|nr:ABC transporter ATP-binding protein [filamentous cyanobacterium LEGE 07170]